MAMPMTAGQLERFARARVKAQRRQAQVQVQAA